MRGYDVVQVTNPVFFDLRPEKNWAIFKYLKKHNKKIFLDALAIDHYYVKACLDGKTFRYSDFFVGDRPLPHPEREKMLADKLAYIPIPIDLSINPFHPIKSTPEVVKFFIGIQQHRTAIKGTDILLDVLREIHDKYPRESHIQKVVSVPFDEYNKLLVDCHILLDQLYSYTPATNALAAMARGIIAVYIGINYRDYRPKVDNS